MGGCDKIQVVGAALSQFAEDFAELGCRKKLAIVELAERKILAKETAQSAPGCKNCSGAPSAGNRGLFAAMLSPGSNFDGVACPAEPCLGRIAVNAAVSWAKPAWRHQVLQFSQSALDYVLFGFAGHLV
jgi:hypothetical protein